MKIEYKNKKKTVITYDLVEGKVYKDRDGDIVLVCRDYKVVVIDSSHDNKGGIHHLESVYKSDDVFTELNCTLTIEE